MNNSQYNDLIMDAKCAYQKRYEEKINQLELVRHNATKHYGNIELRWDSEYVGSLCKEINLWSYWQGRNYNPDCADTKYLLVGQDWGNPFGYQDNGTMARIKAMSNGEAVPYMVERTAANEAASPTDFKLVDLFASIGIQDIHVKQYPNLFFTNFCLGYRTGNGSGGMTLGLLMQDATFFKRLVDILRPDQILCLGQIVSKAVVKTLCSAKLKSCSFNQLVDENISYFYKGLDFSCTIHPLFHPGFYGIRNRNGGFLQQLKDWQRISV